MVFRYLFFIHFAVYFRLLSSLCHSECGIYYKFKHFSCVWNEKIRKTRVRSCHGRQSNRFPSKNVVYKRSFRRFKKHYNLNIFIFSTIHKMLFRMCIFYTLTHILLFIVVVVIIAATAAIPTLFFVLPISFILYTVILYNTVYSVFPVYSVLFYNKYCIRFIQWHQLTLTTLKIFSCLRWKKNCRRLYVDDGCACDL